MSKNNNSIAAQGILSNGFGFSPKVVMRDKRLSIEAKAIYCYMSSFAGAGFSAFPSVELIISDLCISENRFYKHREQLELYGYITIEKQRKSNGNNKSVRDNNLYTLNSIPVENPKISAKIKKKKEVTKKKKEAKKTAENGSVEPNSEHLQNEGIEKNSNENQSSEHLQNEGIQNEGLQNEGTNSNTLNSNNLNSNSVNNSSSSKYSKEEEKPLPTTTEKHISFFEEVKKRKITSREKASLEKYKALLNEEMIIAGIEEAIIATDGKFNLTYLNSILQRYVTCGIMSLEQLETDNMIHKARVEAEAKAKKQAAAPKKGNFNNYDQRQYPAGYLDQFAENNKVEG